ncbi:helix-turn-helix transcriptional regulator [Aquimarina sp. 2-A2]|uniref:helix-turn-helix transcriptional regulator n=1 Tax=Aquimarina sp. 2-A2 TaxID=3382644 RepID=UPI00387F3335
MNRLTRISAILTQLQSKKIVKAKEIAERFEISLRTVYRDIKTLQDAGIPIGSENGVGYFMVDGFSLPPMMLTEEEANALIVSEKLILNQGDQSLIRDFSSLLIKIKAILKSVQKDDVTKLSDRLEPSVKRETLKSNWLSTVQKAITKTNVIEIQYNSISKQEQTVREIEPLAIYFTERAWVLVAFCRLRNDLREFRLDRISRVVVSNKSFDFKQDFKLKEYFKNLVKPS